jgi:hypothetical protein
MHRHLNPTLIEKIISTIENLEGKITWPLIVNKLEKTFNISYSRQTLSKCDEIRDAYYLKKEGLTIEKHSTKYYSPREIQKILERIDRLEKENTKLKKQLNNQIAQIAIWSYNANARGITCTELNTPLPFVDRH